MGEDWKMFLTFNASINFLQNHSPETNPGHDLNGAKPSPLGQLLCTKTFPPPLGQNRESKAPPLEHKVRKFRECIYKL